MRLILSAILLSLSMLNTASASPFARPKPSLETPATTSQIPSPAKLNEAAAIITATKHCLSMDGSFNQPTILVDAFNNQSNLETLPKNLSEPEREKIMLYTSGRPDIADFGFLIPEIWRVTNRDARIRFNAIISLKLMEKFGFKYGALAFTGNCKPIMQGDIITRRNFQHAAITMPLAFNDNQVKLTYLMIKQQGYNWQIEDLLFDNIGASHYIRKDLGKSVSEKGIASVTREVCKSSGYGTLKCD